MKKPIINNLFPIPIYSTDIDRNFTKKELDFVKDQKNYCTLGSNKDLTELIL